jgi:hypothetical protein
MTRSSASLRIAVLFLACLAACGGDDGDDDVIATPNLSKDAGADGTTPGNSFEASVEDSTVAETGADSEADDSSTDGAVADGSMADARADGSVADSSVADGSVAEAGADSGIVDARADVSTAEASTDAGKDASIIDAAVDAGPTCSVTNSAPAVTMGVVDASTLPVQTGGTLMTGTYYLTAYTWYGGPSACAGGQVQWTLVVASSSTSAGTISEIYQTPGTAPSCTNDTAYSTSGANLDGSGSGTTFTATTNTITLASADSGQCGSVLTVFTKH